MSLTAQFSMRLAKVREGGKTVEKNVEWVEVSGFPAGDVVSRRARPADRDRFKKAYEAFSAPQTPPNIPAGDVAPLAVESKPGETLRKGLERMQREVLGRRKG